MKFFRNILKKKKKSPLLKVTQLPKKSTSQFCECTHCSIQSIAFVEQAPLENGHWTQFNIHRCKDCGKLSGFPHDNLLTALKYGTKETLDMLKEYGIDINKYRKEHEKEYLAQLNPSKRR